MCTDVRNAILAGLAGLLVLAASPVAQAEPNIEEEARIHFMAGRAHYEKGAFLEAATEFEAAYRISGRPKLLYNVYLAYRDGDALAEAARALEEYLSKEDVIENRQQLEARLKVLQARDGTEPAAAADMQPPVEPVVEPGPPAAVTDTPGDGGGPPVVAYVLMGTGGALALASIPTFIIAGNAGSDLSELCPDQVCASGDAAEAQDLSDRDGTFTTLSYVLLFTGIGTAGAGLLWALLGSGEASEAPPAASLGCHASGCYGSLRMLF